MPHPNSNKGPVSVGVHWDRKVTCGEACDRLGAVPNEIRS